MSVSRSSANHQNDTQLVSILYRTHKSLSGASKIHSLYAFDALARAARNQVVKHKVDLHATGNCATFLTKVEGVLDGLVQEMLSSNHPDAKVSSFFDCYTDDMPGKSCYSYVT